MILIGNKYGQMSSHLYELSGESEENLTWSVLDQKLDVGRHYHVSIPMSEQFIPHQFSKQPLGPGMSAHSSYRWELEEAVKLLNQIPDNHPGLKPNQRDIWQGELKWKHLKSDFSRESCRISSKVKQENNEPEVRSEDWPKNLVMQFIPKSFVSTIGIGKTKKKYNQCCIVETCEGFMFF